MPIQHTTEFVATSEESIQTIAKELATSGRKYKVFAAIYSGGNKPKTAATIADATGLSEVAVLQLGTPMAHKQYFDQVKSENRVAFKKYKHINAVKGRIMKLAKNPRQLEKHVSARTPKQTILVQVDLESAMRSASRKSS